MSFRLLMAKNKKKTGLFSGNHKIRKVGCKTWEIVLETGGNKLVGKLNFLEVIFLRFPFI